MLRIRYSFRSSVWWNMTKSLRLLCIQRFRPLQFYWIFAFSLVFSYSIVGWMLCILDLNAAMPGNYIDCVLCTHIKRLLFFTLYIQVQNESMWNAKLHSARMTSFARICGFSECSDEMRRIEKPWNGQIGRERESVWKRGREKQKKTFTFRMFIYNATTHHWCQCYHCHDFMTGNLCYSIRLR